MQCISGESEEVEMLPLVTTAQHLVGHEVQGTTTDGVPECTE